MIPLKPLVWQRVWSRVGLGVATSTAVLVVGLCAWPYTVDDAFIVARFAQNLALGRGYGLNPGQHADGVTGPAWLLPGVLATWMGVDPVVAAKIIGLVCGVTAALWVMNEQRQRALGSAYAPFAALVLACQPSLGGNCSAGLETGAATLALSIATCATLARPNPEPVRLGAAIALMAWLRPELAVVCLVLLAALSSRRGWPGTWPALGLSLAGAGSIVAFRWLFSGQVIPLAWSAKAGTLGDGVDYSRRALWIVTGLGGIPLAIAGARLGQRRDRVRAWIVLAHVAAVTLAGGDWMPGFRLFVPVLPQYAALTSVGFVAGWRRGRTWVRAAALACAFAACALPLLDLALRIPEWRAAGDSRERVGSTIAARLRAETQRVALVDVGYLGYASGREVIDLAGITEPAVAALPGGHLSKHVPPDWLRERAPDALLLHSSLPPSAADDGRLLALHGYPVEQSVARMPWVLREFRVRQVYEYAPHYYYVLLLRSAQP